MGLEAKPAIIIASSISTRDDSGIHEHIIRETSVARNYFDSTVPLKAITTIWREKRGEHPRTDRSEGCQL
jgi:hypothetical protein